MKEISWKNVLNTENSNLMTIYFAKYEANRLGYEYYSWNDKIYKTVEMTGTSLTVICKTEEVI